MKTHTYTRIAMFLIILSLITGTAGMNSYAAESNLVLSDTGEDLADDQAGTSSDTSQSAGADETQPAEEDAAEIQPAEEDTAEIQPAEEDTAEIQPAEEDTAKIQPAEEDTAEIQPAEEDTAEIQAPADEQVTETNAASAAAPVALGKSGNLYWSNTTVLHWNKVKNAGKYLVHLTLTDGSNYYTRSVTVTNRLYVDLEDQIYALIKTNRAVLQGAAYSVSASVQAVSTDPDIYSDGPVVKGPSFRYLRTTYLEATSRNGWFYQNGNWYFYSAGVKQTGWIMFQKKRYYLQKDGTMAHDCWIGKKYLKSSGEMAKDEWADGGQYYVDQSGNKVSSAAFRPTHWVKDSTGWRYQYKTGKYYKNTWKVIGHRTYYFDSNGYMKTGWFKKDGKKCFLDNTGDLASGYGSLCTGWKKVRSYTYWFDDNGAMVTDSWVDKSQYYVDESGHKLSWIDYANLRNVNTSNRMGYYVYDPGSAPEQSLAGYDVSYQKGNRIMVVDVRFTKDGVPVCFHDEKVKYARTQSGSTPSSLPEVSKLTLAELSKYDFGIYRGSKYKGTGPLTLTEMAKWVRSHTDTDMYIEVKTNSNSTAQLQKISTILTKYSVSGRSSVIFAVNESSDTRASRLHSIDPSLRIGLTTSFVADVAFDQLQKCKGDGNDVFLWCWSNTKLTDGNTQKLKNLDAQFECGTYAKLETFADIIGYYSTGSAYAYCSGIETPGKIFQTALRTATCHNAAKWVSTSTGKKYKQIDGTYARSKWVTISGMKYHFDSKGNMQTGWLSLGGKLYYLTSKGTMVTGSRLIGGHRYIFDENGVMVRKVS